jgi:hypothetical protein
VTFDGIAPIPSKTKVRMLLDDPMNPVKVLQIEDEQNRITYTSQEIERAGFEPIENAGIPNFVEVQVEHVIISSPRNKTIISFTP